MSAPATARDKHYLIYQPLVTPSAEWKQQTGWSTWSEGTDGGRQMRTAPLRAQKNRGFVITVTNHCNKSRLTIESGVAGAGDSCRLWQLVSARGARRQLHFDQTSSPLNEEASVCFQLCQYHWDKPVQRKQVFQFLQNEISWKSLLSSARFTTQCHAQVSH